ncbi:hypothetical protein VXE65_00040 [Mycolicibacterium conceptionense]
MVDYWHGGRRGIKVGDLLKGPYARKQEWSLTERNIERQHLHRGIYNSERDPRRVYFTTDRELARGWAMHAMLQAEGGGALYRVKPLPPSSLEPDPDIRATGFSARRAEVLEVVEDLVQMDEDDALRATNWKYTLWEDDSPMYDYDGYMLPSPEHRNGGATPDLFRHLGKWFHVPPDHVVVWRGTGRVFVLPRSALDSFG